MRKFFIIILDPNSDSALIRAKIGELGDYYNIYNNQYLVCLDCDSPQELYNRLQPINTSPVGIVIFGVPMESLTFWGYSDKGLWTWLRNQV